MLRISGMKKFTLFEMFVILYPLIQFSYIKILFDNKIMLDLILYFTMIIAAMISIVNMKNSFKLDKLSIALIYFTIWVIVSSFYSISSVYSSEKLELLLRAGLFYFLIRNIVLNYLDSDRVSLIKLFRWVFFTNTFFIIIYFILNYSTVIESVLLGLRFETELANPIWLSRFVFETMLGLIILIKLKACRKKWLLIFIPMLLLGIVSGSKGPIISFVIAYITFIFIYYPDTGNDIRQRVRIIFRKFRYLILICIVISSVVLLAINIFPKDYLESRFSIENTFDKTEGHRSERYSVTFDIISNNFILGVGLGSWPIYYKGIDEIDYPHNIFLELLSETGIIGTVLFLIMVLLATWRLRRKTMEYKFVYVMFIFNLMNAMFSGDFASGNRGIFIYMGILSAINLNNYIGKVRCNSLTHKYNMLSTEKK